MKRIKFKTAVRVTAGLALIGLLTGLYIYLRTQWIPAGYVGVIYDANSGLQSKIYKPQAVTVGWRQQLYVYPTQVQNAIYSQDASSGEERSADGIQITTNDNANTIFDVSVVYRVRPEDVVKVFNSFGPVPIEEIQATYIRRAVKDAANAVGPQYDLFSLMGPKRQEASQRLTEEARKRLSVNGISVEIAMLGSCYPSEQIQAKITSRVNSYIELEISRLRREIAEIQRQVAVVQGEADTKARALSASQTKDRSIEMLRLQAAQEAIKKWDGNLPPISTKPGQTVVVTPDMLTKMGGGR